MALAYLTDKQLFVLTDEPARRPFSRQNAIQLYQQLNKDKTLLQAEDYIDTLMATSTLTSSMLKRQRKQEQSGPSFEEMWEASRHLFPIYKRLNANGQHQLFFVSEDKQVTKIHDVDSNALVNALMFRTEAFAKIRRFYFENEMFEHIRPKLSLKDFVIKMITQYLDVDERHTFAEEPRQISWDNDTYAYKKMNPALLKPGPTPNWDQFLARLDYPEVFCAWVWSIFEPKNNIRQVLWLRGAGNDGKSSVQKALTAVIGNDYCYSMKNNDENQQWFQHNVFGKVLVNYADCKNPFLIDNPNVKQLSGGDSTSIEGKGVNSFTGTVYSKILVTSNIRPLINPDAEAHTSRLIKIEVKAPEAGTKSADFQAGLEAEIYAFLHKCQTHFEDLVADKHSRLLLPDELVNSMNLECASETYLNVEDFIDEEIEFGLDYTVFVNDLEQTFKRYMLDKKGLDSQRIKWHLDFFKVKINARNCGNTRELNSRGTYSLAVRGLRLKNGADT
jgi:hypothetical protein